MGTSKTITAAVLGVTITGAGLWNAADTIATAMWPQQGTPSKQPEPKNPTPRPKNPTPRPSDPLPDPNSPGAPNRQPGDRPADRDGDRNRTRGVNRERSTRPFAFQSPDLEGRFNQSTRRLALMEQRMQRSHEDLLKRLGEARQLSGERRADALFDVIQQLLKDQADLQRYLVQSRTAWTGDLDGDIDLDDEESDVEAAVPERGTR